MSTRRKLSLSGQKESKFRRWSFGRDKGSLRSRNALHATKRFNPGDRPPSKILLAVLLIVVSFGIMAAAAAWAIIVGIGRNFDEDLCRNGVASEVYVLFIVDLTDGLSDACFTAFQDEFRFRLDRLQVYERISLYVIRQKGLYPTARGVRLFSRCRPRDGSDADPKFENPKRIKKKFEEEFLTPLQKGVAGIDPDHRANRSLILETLRALGRTPEFAGAKKREIYYFGNLLQNSSRINQYEHGWEDFEGLLKRSLQVLDVENLLTGTDVTVFLMPDPKQTAQHSAWWQAYFKFANVGSFTVKLL